MNLLYYDKRLDGILFSEAPGRAVASLNPADLDRVAVLTTEYGIEMQTLGSVEGDQISCFSDRNEVVKLAVEQARRICEEAIDCYMK